jgi:adenylosuccinate lyase
MTREDAYVVVQRNAMKVWEDIQQAVDGPTFRENLEADEDCTLTSEQLDNIFDPWTFLQRRDVMFNKLEGLEF